MSKQGSVILIVLMMLAVLAIIGFTIMRNTTFLVDGALAREQYAKQYYATEALMHYGIDLGLQYFDTFKQYQKEVVVEVGAWPLPNSPYNGKLLFIPSEQDITLQALLEKKGYAYCMITCMMTRNKGIVEICNWRIGTQ